MSRCSSLKAKESYIIFRQQPSHKVTIIPTPFVFSFITIHFLLPFNSFHLPFPHESLQSRSIEGSNDFRPSWANSSVHYEFCYESGRYIFMIEFICWERGGGQRLIAAVHSFSFSRLLPSPSGPFLFITFRIESTERERERQRQRGLPSMLRVPSNWFQSGPPIRSPNKTWGKYFRSNYTATYIRICSTHARPRDPLNANRVSRGSRDCAQRPSVKFFNLEELQLLNYCIVYFFIEKILPRIRFFFFLTMQYLYFM